MDERALVELLRTAQDAGKVRQRLHSHPLSGRGILLSIYDILVVKSRKDAQNVVCHRVACGHLHYSPGECTQAFYSWLCT